MLERLVLHCPDLAAGGGRSDFVDIGSEHDRAVFVTGPAQQDVVVARIGIEKDAGAIEGEQSAVRAIERLAIDVDEADIGDVRSGIRGDGERCAAVVGSVIAAQGRTRCSTCPECRQTGREVRG
ncbi:hypothetical protein FQZ97_995020 [compost metagenome]